MPIFEKQNKIQELKNMYHNVIHVFLNQYNFNDKNNSIYNIRSG